MIETFPNTLTFFSPKCLVRSSWYNKRTSLKSAKFVEICGTQVTLKHCSTNNERTKYYLWLNIIIMEREAHFDLKLFRRWNRLVLRPDTMSIISWLLMKNFSRVELFRKHQCSLAIFRMISFVLMFDSPNKGFSVFDSNFGGIQRRISHA